MPTETINLDEADGWIHLVNVCDQHRDKTVIVNTAARNNNAVTQFGQTLDTTLDELGRKLVALWVINRQRDSLELLKEFMGAIPNALVHVVRNGYFGEERKFELYNNSKLREAIEGKGGKSITLPDLADRVADDVYTRRMSLAAAAKVLPLGNRAELARWRGENEEGSGGDASNEHRKCVRQDPRARAVGQGARTSLSRPGCARDPRERRLLVHRHDTRALRLALS